MDLNLTAVAWLRQMDLVHDAEEQQHGRRRHPRPVAGHRVAAETFNAPAPLTRTVS